MTPPENLIPRSPDPALHGMIKLAVMAVGGQGGGVLASWIEDLARANGYSAQATSVAGVAQRTGATIYYIEMAPAAGRNPVFSLAPAAGDVDIVIAAEMMEAGRAILRGFVTPDRTTLIASTHRALAVSEKSVPGDGIANSDEVRAAAGVAARASLMFDMEAVALAHGSVISASLFGALAGSGALPFARAAFEATIRASGKGVEPSLRAFAAAADLAGAAGEGGPPPPPAIVPKPQDARPASRSQAALMAQWAALLGRVRALPEAAQDLALAGLRKVVDFQDMAYGAAYLTRLEDMARRDIAAKGHALTREAAKYIANAMAYDDVIRVADLKTRGPRFARIRTEMAVTDDHLLGLTEFFHPRAEEITGLLPARLGARWQADARVMARLDRWFGKGRRIRTNRVVPFLVLYVIGGLRGWRLKTLRHQQEGAHLDHWLATAQSHLPMRYDLAVEVIRCRRLIKGYSDTHARGLSKYDRVMAVLPDLARREDAADWLRRLRDAALQDEEGAALAGALATVRSFL